MAILPLCLALVVPLLGQEAPRPEASESPNAPAHVTRSTPPDPVEPVLPPDPPAAPTEHAVVSRVLLEDGQELRGVVVRRDEQFLVLELADGRRLQLPARTVKGVEEAHARVREQEIWREDPNRTHYLYGPSAMMPHKGEGSVSLTEGVLATVSYGLTDHLSLQAGGVWPAYFLGIVNVMAGIKVGGSLGDRVHLAAGAQALFIPKLWNVSRFAALGVLHGTVTYGTPDAHLSLTAATPFQVADFVANLPPLRNFLFSLSGNLRVGQSVALVTENWVAYLPAYTDPRPVILPSAGVRLFGEHWAVTLGALVVIGPHGSAPFPWVDLTYQFGP